MPELPAIWYGTAWKQDRTEPLTARALAVGFRAIDTANQRKHYHEAAVGAAVAGAGLARDQLVLQSKFTHVGGQDHRLPYDPRAPIAAQVAQSFASSLDHLGTTYLDSYLLHGPSTHHGLAAQDVEAWRAIEALADRGAARAIGISNVTAAQLDQLCELARIPPAVVQNRCYAHTGWDAEVRLVCRRRGVRYQGFSLLTANPRAVAGPEVGAIAARLGATREQVVFRFALAIGIVPLTGTSSERHMCDDLAAEGLALTAEDVRALERIGRAG
jgi:diketogulonate reductase-like aldo/keto reductase